MAPSSSSQPDKFASKNITTVASTTVVDQSSIRPLSDTIKGRAKEVDKAETDAETTTPSKEEAEAIEKYLDDYDDDGKPPVTGSGEVGKTTQSKPVDEVVEYCQGKQKDKKKCETALAKRVKEGKISVKLSEKHLKPFCERMVKQKKYTDTGACKKDMVPKLKTAKLLRKYFPKDGKRAGADAESGNLGLIVGICCAVVVLLVFLVVIYCCCCSRSKSGRRSRAGASKSSKSRRGSAKSKNSGRSGRSSRHSRQSKRSAKGSRKSRKR